MLRFEFEIADYFRCTTQPDNKGHNVLVGILHLSTQAVQRMLLKVYDFVVHFIFHESHCKQLRS